MIETKLQRAARLKAWAICLGAFVATAGCSTPYKALDMWGSGYEDLQIDDNTFRINYYGASNQPKEMIDLYALYRCAVLTVAKGYDYFVLASESDNQQASTNISSNVATETREPSGDIPPGSTSTTSKTSVHSKTKYSVTKTFHGFNGTKPADNFNAYDARSVLSNLGSKIER